MLLNLKRWRDYNIAAKVIDFVDKNPSVIKFVDQCGLNAIIDGNWKQLHLKFNQQAVIFEKDFLKKYSCFTTPVLIEAKKNPVIIHYSGSSKPWHIGNKHPFRHLYWYYLRKTHYRFKLLEKLTGVNVIKWILPEFIIYFLRKLKPKNK
jgi:lipopolysaccharide biosynthesis glycosyltransferase